MSQLSARLDLPVNRPDAPRYARRAARMMLAGWGFQDPRWLDDAELVVSELVTNAVRHGGGLIELRLEAHDEAILVSAADGSSVVPRRRAPDGGPRDDGGRGIAIIEEFAQDWGVENHEGGKRVWVRLAAPPTQPARRMS